MAIYSASCLPRLARSKDRLDRKAMEFLKRKGIFEISYKEYKYLRVGITAMDVSRKLSGGSPKNTDEYFCFCLKAASQDDEVEKGAEFRLPCLAKEDLDVFNANSRAELGAGSFKSYIAARERFGNEAGGIFGAMVGDAWHQYFWKSIACAAFMIDTAADYRKDVKSGIVARASASDLLELAGKIKKYCWEVIRQLGIISTFRMLFVPTIHAIMGGFEDERKKCEPQEIRL